MKLLLIPIICLVLGVGGGVGAGIFLLPTPEPDSDAEAIEGEPDEVSVGDNDTHGDELPTGVEYVDLSNQFIVPILVDGRVAAIVILAIGLELKEGTMQEVMLSEPKLRAAFLQTLFNHANNGGFDGNFTDFSTVETLKRELLLVAQSISGRSVSDVLVLDMVKQNP